MGDWDDWPDNDGDATDWENPRPRPVFFRRNIKDLIDYFSYHKSMGDMTKLVDQEDKNLLGYTFIRLTKAGYTDVSLRTSVDVFFQSIASDSSKPARAFLSREVMDACLEGTVVTVSPEDHPIFHWMLGDMGKSEVLSEVKDKRRAVLLACNDSFRYPEVIAEILAADKSFIYTYAVLSALESVVKYNLAGKPYNKSDVDPHLALIRWCDLPKELKSNIPSPRGIRPERGTLSQYVTAYLLKRQEVKEYEEIAG